MPLTVEALEKALSVYGFIVRRAHVSPTEELVILTDSVTKTSVTFTMSRDGKVLDDLGRRNLPRIAPVAVTNSGYLILLSDLERQVTELVKQGELKELEAVLVVDGTHDYLLPADMKSALPPDIWCEDVAAYEDTSMGFIVIYGPRVYRTLNKRRKRSKDLYVSVNGVKPERVLDKLWKQFLNVE